MLKKVKNIWIAYHKVKSEKKFDQKHSLNHSIDQKITSIVQQLNEKGIAVLPQYFGKQKCKACIQDLVKLKKTRLTDFWVDKHGSDHRLFRAQQVSKVISEFNADPFLKKIGEAYLSYPLQNYMTLAGHTQYTAQNLGSGGGWHRDSAFSKQFKAIVYLNDVSIENGPFQICTSSNSYTHAIQHINLADPTNHCRYSPAVIDEAKFKQQIITAKAGSVILVDTMGIHRGSPILKGERFALTNYYVGSHRFHEFESYFSSFKHLETV